MPASATSRPPPCVCLCVVPRGDPGLRAPPRPISEQGLYSPVKQTMHSERISEQQWSAECAPVWGPSAHHPGWTRGFRPRTSIHRAGCFCQTVQWPRGWQAPGQAFSSEQQGQNFPGGDRRAVVPSVSPGKPLPQAWLHFWRRRVPDASGSFSWVLGDHTSRKLSPDPASWKQ